MREKREEEDELLTRLEVIGDGGWFMWKIFILCTVPSILNGLHLTSYLYLAEVPDHWCFPPDMANSSWTEDEVRLVSSPNKSNESSCEHYNWEYKILSNMNFTEAMEYLKRQEKPELVPCTQYHYAEGSSSIVINYDLVCNRTPLRSMIQVSLSLGKFLGALTCGLISDKYGRKRSFLLGCVIYFLSGPMVAFAVDYSMIVAGRIGLGAANLAIYNSAYIILSEIASKRRRSVLGILYNMSYPIGQMIIPLLAYFFRDWRTLQILISVPSILVLIFYWFLPESPRWLILNGKRSEASKIINKAFRSNGKGGEVCELGTKAAMVDKKEEDYLEPVRNAETSSENKSNFILEKLKATFNQVLELVRHVELRGRTLIVLATWCICSLSFYVLALNVDNFLADRYLYGFVSGAVEMSSYLLPLPMLRYFGRRTTSITLFYIGGLALLIILVIPRHEDVTVLVVASVGRLCVSAVFAVVILHTTELFPTLLRNTGIGCCATMAHIGSMGAPLIVDILGAYAWFIPSTVCGVVTILAGTMIFLLPETRNKSLPDTVEDITNSPKTEKMGFHQICL